MDHASGVSKDDANAVHLDGVRPRSRVARRRVVLPSPHLVGEIDEISVVEIIDGLRHVDARVIIWKRRDRTIGGREPAFYLGAQEVAEALVQDVSELRRSFISA